MLARGKLEIEEKFNEWGLLAFGENAVELPFDAEISDIYDA